MTYGIIADSGCDIDLEMRKRLGVDVAPLTIDVNGKTYIDDGSIVVSELVKDIAADKNIAQTACPSPEEFAVHFRKYDASFCVTLSSQLSGSYNSARVAKEMVLAESPDKFIHIVDSMSAGAGGILTVTKLHELVSQELPPEEIAKKITEIVKDSFTLFVLENLGTLMKSGRMPKVKGFIATVMNIRPLMYAEGGAIFLGETIRGTQKALIRLVEKIGEVCENIAERTIVITHCNNENRAKFVKALVNTSYAFKDIIVRENIGLSATYANDGGIIVAF